MTTPCIITRALRRIHLRPLTAEEVRKQEVQLSVSTFWEKLEALAEKQSITQPLVAIQTAQQAEKQA